mgnify:CR=1 FL=1
MVARPGSDPVALERLPRLQTNRLPPATFVTAPHEPWLGIGAETVNGPAARIVSVTTTFRAHEGPWLSMKSVQVIGWP